MRKLWMRLALAFSNSTGLRIDRALARTTGFSLINQFYSRAGGFTPRPCLLVTTRHHKTGARRTVVLPYRKDGDAWLVVGSHGGRPTDAIWAKNLRANPLVEIRVDRRDVQVEAIDTSGTERARVWEIVSDDGAYTAYAKSADPRVIPVFRLQPA
jgi:deazaflavin-dependent oxidoreductase (nitroreductase family)